MTAPSKLLSGRTVEMNMAGVVTRPQSKPCAPANPARTPAFMISAVRRLSWPTPRRRSCLALPVRFSMKATKDAAISEAISPVRFSGSVAVAIALPRTSLPF